METKFSHQFESYLLGQAKSWFKKKQKKTKICIPGAKIACLGNDPWLSQHLVRG